MKGRFQSYWTSQLEREGKIYQKEAKTTGLKAIKNNSQLTEMMRSKKLNGKGTKCGPT